MDRTENKMKIVIPIEDLLGRLTHFSYGSERMMKNLSRKIRVKIIEKERKVKVSLIITAKMTVMKASLLTQSYFLSFKATLKKSKCGNL